jgi:hypothetical protein
MAHVVAAASRASWGVTRIPRRLAVCLVMTGPTAEYDSAPPFGAHPKSFASLNTEHPRSHEIEIIQKLLAKRLGNLEFKVSIRLGFFRLDDDKPTIVLIDHIATDFERGVVLMP